MQGKLGTKPKGNRVESKREKSEPLEKLKDKTHNR